MQPEPMPGCRPKPLSPSDAPLKAVARQRPSAAGIGQRILKALTDAFLPVRCAACRAFIQPAGSKGAGPDSASAGWPGSPLAATNRLTPVLCADCREEIVAVDSPLCTICGVPFESRVGGDHACGNCIGHPRYFRRARAAVIDTPVMMALVHRFKYGGRVQLARPMGALLADAYRRFWPEVDIDVFLPVPLHGSRFRRRGFNQAYLLAQACTRCQPPAAAIARDALSRRRATPPQAGMARRDRLRNIKNAFKVEKPAVIRGRRILLVDDVYTTGATVDECARSLQKAGAARVDVLTLVRAA
jgi:ComF family protein